jgi:hypothetical protein
MTTITSSFTASGAESLARSPTLPPAHLKTMQAIGACRTGAYGSSLSPCHSCGQPHRLSPACGNRPCPQCQHQKARQWLHTQLHTQLPGPSFLSTFPIPATLRPFCRAPPRLASQALCKASSAARKRLARAARFLGTALPGFPGILPTGGRQLPYHPHLHSMVPGGGLSQDRAAWWPSRANFSVPVKALSPVSRALFKAEMHTAGLGEQIAPQVWHTPWNVHRQANPHGATSWQSLAPSVCKVASSNRRLISLQDPIVTCTYRTPGSARPRTTRLDVLECMRRFLPHVLPSGFMKVRHCGFMSASCAINTPAIRRMMAETNDATPAPPATPGAPSPPFSCPHCGGALRVRMRVLPSQEACVDTG